MIYLFLIECKYYNLNKYWIFFGQNNFICYLYLITYKNYSVKQIRVYLLNKYCNTALYRYNGKFNMMLLV